MKKPISFVIKKKINGALGRSGVISTSHGDINTPSFVTVGTKATVKGLTKEMLASVPVQVVLANTYHLYLQPGSEIVKAHGGFSSMMGWEGPSMTDSGGFQVFSLGAAYGKGISKVTQITDPNLLLKERSDEMLEKLATVGEDGVSFKSHIDGSLHYITPEKSIEIQHDLGADIIFTFDECTSPTEEYAYQKQSIQRTHAWAKRSLLYHRSKKISETQALFGIVQGGRHEDLRKESAEIIGSMDFEGFGIGGSFAKEDMETAVRWVNEILPEEKPRHLLGIGEPKDIFMGIENGCDLFDCVMPTRIARTGAFLTKEGRLNIFNTAFQTDMKKIEEDCSCYTCSNYTRSYLAHLFRSKEMLGATLATIHNLYFTHVLFEDIRESIQDETFFEFKDKFLKKYYKV